MHDVQQRRLIADVRGRIFIGQPHSIANRNLIAIAATTLAMVTARLVLGFASGLFALQFALGLRAQRGLLALPIALGLFAHWRADGIGRDAGCVANSRTAHSLALGARILLAHLLRATNSALRLLAVDSALGARSLFTLHLAAWPFTNRVALRWAHWIVALPPALWMAPFGG